MDFLTSITRSYEQDGYIYRYKPTKRDKLAFVLMGFVLSIAHTEFRHIVTDLNFRHLGSQLFERKPSAVRVSDRLDVPFDMEKS
jgi:hypothetical protein